MKTTVKKCFLFAIISTGYLSYAQANSISTSTVYIIEKSKSTPNALTVHVTRSNKSSKTQLILRGASMGIPKQVQNIVCDDDPIKESEPGVWQIPPGCQSLQWQILLNQNGADLASAQQSISSGDFILFSEVSSLPRLEDATSENIKILIPGIRTVFPKTRSLNEVSLPNTNSAPFFLILNPTIVGTNSSYSIKLTYLADTSDAISKLPNRGSHMMALKWLYAIIPSRSKENFTLIWLGTKTKKPSLAGAAGNEILLTNYPSEGEFPLGQTMLLYVALHEAFHQLASNYSKQPTWVSESLASYYGVRALKIALPNHSDVSTLTEKFLASADYYKDGLVTINRKVQNGDKSQYGAFYTKGIAFWMAVDQALKQTQNKSLDNYLQVILKAKYNFYGEPINIQKVLNLAPETWSILYDRFLY